MIFNEFDAAGACPRPRSSLEGTPANLRCLETVTNPATIPPEQRRRGDARRNLPA
jgi:hypothetical protein